MVDIDYGSDIPENAAQNPDNESKETLSNPEQEREPKDRTLAMIACIVLLIAGVAGAIGGYLYFSYHIPIWKTERAISEIGTVTLESGVQIQEVEMMYGSLSYEARAEVENADVLTDAREAYERKVTAVDTASRGIEAAKHVTYYVDGKPYVNTSDADVVETAEKAYEALKAEDLTSYLTGQLPDLQSAKAGLDNYRANILYQDAAVNRERGSYESAIVDYLAFLESYPDHPLAGAAKTEVSLCYLALGDGAYKNKEYEAALELYKQAVQADSSCTDGKTGAMNCTVKLLEEDLRQDNLEKVVTALDTARQAYGDTDESERFWVRLERRLQQIRPWSGTVLTRTTIWGQGVLTLHGGKQDAVVKIESYWDPEKYILIFVRADSKVKIDIQDGSYQVKCATGEHWYGKETLFGEDTVYQNTDQGFGMGNYFGRFAYYSHTISLGETVRTEITADAF